MLPAAILSILVKTDGAKLAATQLAAIDGVAKKTAVSMDATAVASNRAAAAQGRLAGAAAKGRGALAAVARPTGFLALAVGAIGAASVKTAADYEQSMNSLKAVSGATEAQMKQLSRTAIKLGADVKLPGTSAQDAAEAMTEMVKAGLSVDDTMSGVRSTLVLSAAAQIGNAAAAKITSRAMNTFGLKGKDVTMITDQLANVANASSVEITDVADSMKMAGAVFKAFQGPVVGAKGAMTELNVAIGLLGNAGVVGSDAGTSLKQALLQLTAPSQKSKDAMKALYGASLKTAGAQEALGKVMKGGQSDRTEAIAALQKMNPELKKGGDIAYDSAGKMRSLRDIIRLVAAGTKGMTQEQKNWYISQIFGADATRSVSILLEQQGKQWDAMEGKVTKAGSAQELASAKMKGLKGAIDALKSSLQTFGIQIGTYLLPPLTTVVRGAAGFVSDFGAKLTGGLEEALRKGSDTAFDPITGAGGKVADGWLRGFIGPASAGVKKFFETWFGSSSDVDPISGSGGKWAGSFSQAITDAFKAIDWAGIATIIGDGIKGALKGIQIAGKAGTDFAVQMAAGIQMAMSNIDGRQLLGGLLDVVGEALDALFSPSFWVEHFAAIFGIVTFVIPVGKIFKLPGFATLYKFISEPIFKAVGAVGRGLRSLLGKAGDVAWTDFLVEIEKFAPRIANAMLNLTTGALGAVKSLPRKVVAEVQVMLQLMAVAIGRGTGTVVGTMGRLVLKLLDAFGRLVVSLPAVAGRALSALGARLLSWVSTAGDVGRKIAQSLAGGLVAALASGFTDAKGKVVGFINDIIDVINKLPFVDIGKIKNGSSGAVRDAVEHRQRPNGLAQGGAFAATGGVVNRPMVMMGEEAPRHPEFVIPTNPAYRARAQGLLAQASQAVGYARGGIIGKALGAAESVIGAGAGAITKLLPGTGSLPDWLKGTGKYVLDKAAKFIKDKASSALSSLTGGGGGGGGGGDQATSTKGLVPRVVAALAFARSHGWKGQVNSGFRSDAEQVRIWNSGVRPAAKPRSLGGPGSNHSLGQAVDVSDIPGFQRAMNMMPADKRLYSRVPNDAVHFSVTGHRRGGILKRFARGGVNGPRAHAASLPGNVRAVAQFLAGKGFTPAQIAGIIGVMQGESGKGLDPTATNPGKDHAYGIAQWLGSRKAALMSRRNPSSLQTQLNFLWSELQGPESAAFARIKGAHSIPDAVVAWMDGFERGSPAERTIGARTANARAVFAGLGSTGGASAGGGTGGGTGGSTGGGVNVEAIKRQISKNKDRLDRLRSQAAHLPTPAPGKKGAAQRAANAAKRTQIQDQIRALLAKNRHLNEQKSGVKAPAIVSKFDEMVANASLRAAQVQQQLGVSDLTASSFVTDDHGGYNTAAAKKAAKALLPQQKALAFRISQLRGKLDERGHSKAARARWKTELAEKLGSYQQIKAQRQELLTGPADTSGPITQEDIINQHIAQAGLTADSADDKAAAAENLDYRQGKYQQALQGGDPRVIAEAANNLKAAMDANTQAHQDEIDAMKEHTEALNAARLEMKRQTDFGQAVMTTENYQLKKAIADLVGSGLGAAVTQRGFMPGYGKVASY